MVASVPARLEPVTATALQREFRLGRTVEIRLPSGYRRVLQGGSRWRLMGHLPQGGVYRPVGTVFSIEGRQVHEAYLVIDPNDALAGFYLPGEARYSPLDPAVHLFKEVIP